MSHNQKQAALQILEEAKHALSKLGSLVKQLEDAIGESPLIQAANDDPPGGNNPGAPDIP